MTWTRTQAWWQIVLEVVDEIEARRDGTLPWKQRYAEVFPDPVSLNEALRYYWQLVVAPQPDMSGYAALQMVLDRANPRTSNAATGPTSAQTRRERTSPTRPL
jgi:hypothetical protein